jgi:hypothetical protein
LHRYKKKLVGTVASEKNRIIRVLEDANIGIQRNNLNEQKIATMKRYVGAFNIIFSPTPKWNLAAGYSNFQTFTRIRTEFEKVNQLTSYNSLDTLNYVQLTQSANFNASHIIGNI